MLVIILSFACLIAIATAECYDAVPAFPVPQWQDGKHDLAPAFLTLTSKLDDLAANKKYDAASFSVEVTSSRLSLWSHHHTARKRNETRPGAEIVDGDSLYRIASITKVFTVLGLLYQHEAGKLNLDTPIAAYIPELARPDSGEIPFKDITLRALASQLSGIPRDFAQGDVENAVPDPTQFGLPPVESKEVPPCDEYDGYVSACNATDLLNWLKKAHPTFAPNQQSTYSNLNFELIGLALEYATNMSYIDYMQDAIFDLLNMSSTTITTPPDTHAVLPLGPNYWGVEEGVQNPTGGIYSSTNDMCKLLRYIMTHYNALATGVNWLMPASWSPNVYSFYGMPWEIFRSNKVLEDSKRPVTFATKSGGLPGYVSRISIMPEYGLGVTILVGCEDATCGELLGELQETVTIILTRAAETVAWEGVDEAYSGSYHAVDHSLNSTIELGSSPTAGLTLNKFISNSTDVMATVVPQYFVDPTRKWRVQLMPTLLFKDEKKQEGEIWRLIPEYEREDKGIWDDFCFGDVEGPLYAGLPMNELVFWREAGVVRATGVEGENEEGQKGCLKRTFWSHRHNEVRDSIY